jgi:hypothetical protein
MTVVNMSLGASRGLLDMGIIVGLGTISRENIYLVYRLGIKPTVLCLIYATLATTQPKYQCSTIPPTYETHSFRYRPPTFINSPWISNFAIVNQQLLSCI